MYKWSTVGGMIFYEFFVSVLSADLLWCSKKVSEVDSTGTKNPSTSIFKLALLLSRLLCPFEYQSFHFFAKFLDANADPFQIGFSRI